MNYILLACFCMCTWKWVLTLLYMPVIYFKALRSRKGDKLLYKLLSQPYWRIEKLTRGGASRFVLFNIGLIPSVSIRHLFYTMGGVKMGKNVIFHWRTEIRRPDMLSIGDGCIIGDNAILDARQGLTFGRNVNLSSNVSIYTLQHDHRDPNFACNQDKKKMSVEIDDRVWLGSNVIVLPGVHIGEGAVCCAGCVVTKDVEPYAVVAGIPAKKVSERPHNLEYEFKGKSCWFY